jgi:hypothetical protein
LAKNPTIANVKSVADLANMVVNAESKIGQLSAAAPKADAKLEEVGKYMQTKYAPKEAKDYGLETKPEGLPEGVEFKAEAATEFANFAHEIGLHPAQAKAVQGFAAKLATASQEARAAEAKALTDSYKSKWGADFENRVDLNGRLLTQHLGPEEVQKLSALSGDARMMLAVAIDSIREKYVSQDTITPPTATGSAGDAGKSLAQLQQEMHTLQNDPAYFNPQSDKARHEEVRKQVSALSSQIAKLKGGTK